MAGKIVKLPGDAGTRSHIIFTDGNEAGKYFYKVWLESINKRNLA